jgi:peptide/nickel transport system substrate-binding protein
MLTRPKRLRVLGVLVAVFAVVVFSACGGDTKDEDAGVLRWVPQGGLQTTDPVWTGAAVTATIAWHIYDQLINEDAQGALQPQMLDNWTMEDGGTSIKFTLRDKLTWHDGSQVEVEDILASIARFRLQDDYEVFYGPLLQQIQKVDDSTFKVTFSESNVIFLSTLGKTADPHPVMVPKEQVAGVAKGEQMHGAVGSGPYKIARWTPGDRLTLERHEDYEPRDEPASYAAGGKVAYFDTLDMIEIPEAETRISALLTGEIDFVDTVAPDFYDQLKRNPNITVVVGKVGKQPSIILNKFNPPFDHTTKGKLMRQAVQAAINAEAVMQAYGPSELWNLCASMWACDGFWENDTSVELFNQNNPEKARALLEEAGYDGEPILLHNPTDFPTIQILGPVVKSQLEAVGFNFDYRAIDFATEVQLWNGEDDWEILPIWAGGSIVYPLNNDMVTKFGGTPGMEDLREKFVQAGSLEAQKQIASEFQALYFEEAPFVHFGNFFPLYAMSSDLKGFVGDALGSPLFYNLRR